MSKTTLRLLAAIIYMAYILVGSIMAILSAHIYGALVAYIVFAILIIYLAWAIFGKETN